MNLVSQLYSAIPEFAEINDPFFDNYDFTVYDNFGLFLEDMVQKHKHGKIVDPKYFGDYDLQQKYEKFDLPALIKKSFDFIEDTFNNGTDHARTVLKTSFFKIVITSDILMEYASKYLSKKVTDEFTDFWIVK